jgi:Bacterial regulatory protein, Fis family
MIGLEDLPDRVRAREQGLGLLRIELPDGGLSLETAERDLLQAALEKHDWNQTRAAAYLDITRSALLYRMQKFGLEKPKPSLTPVEHPRSTDKVARNSHDLSKAAGMPADFPVDFFGSP